jgi:hypothetical protein
MTGLLLTYAVLGLSLGLLTGVGGVGRQLLDYRLLLLLVLALPAAALAGYSLAKKRRTLSQLPDIDDAEFARVLREKYGVPLNSPWKRGAD